MPVKTLMLLSVLSATAPLCSCAHNRSLDPRAEQTVAMSAVAHDAATTMTLANRAPFFVEPFYRVEASQTRFNSDGTTTVIRSFAQVGADASEARGFWGDAWKATVAFLGGLFFGSGEVATVTGM